MSVTQGDINMVDHFLIERGDIERWTEWEERKPHIEKEFPELIKAIDDLKIAEKTLSRIANNIFDNCYRYPE